MANTRSHAFPYLLTQAREQKHWTQLQLAMHMGVTTITISRWENGHTFPHLSQVEALCKAFGKSAEELGLGKSTPPGKSSSPAEELGSGKSVPPGKSCSPVAQSENRKTWYSNLTTRLFEPVVNTVHVATKDLCQLQAEIDTVLEEANLMETTNPNYHITRRETLACLATFPQILLYNDTVKLTKPSITERVLKECAAGITACGHLTTGSYEDTLLAHQALTSYVPGLKTIVEHSSQYRSSAAQLLYQCFHIKTELAYDIEGKKQSLAYAKQAVIYAKESGVRILYISALRNLSMAYIDNDYTQALLVAQKAANQLKLPGVPIHPFIQSWVHAGLVRPLTKENKPGVEEALRLAYDTFSQEARSQDEELPDFSQHSYANIVRQDAMGHLYMRKPLDALNKFGQILDFDDEQVKLKPGMGISLLRYGGVVKEATLASLKVPGSKKDKALSVRLWKAGWQAGKESNSEEGLQKAIGLQEIMEGIWSDDTEVLELHDLIEDYLKERGKNT